LQGVCKESLKELQGVSRSCKESQGVARSLKELQGVSRSCKELQGQSQGVCKESQGESQGVARRVSMSLKYLRKKEGPLKEKYLKEQRSTLGFVDSLESKNKTNAPRC
jgi:hypothetical protein